MMTNTALKRIWLLAGLLLLLAWGAGQLPVAYAATITVTNLNDSGAGSLRQAIAGATAGDTIDFVVAGTITLTSGELVIDKNLSIQGSGATNVTVDGNNASRVFVISAGTVEMSGLTIRNGSLSGSSSGGGIQSFGTLTLNSITVSDNKAGIGGGIANFATLTLNNSTVSGNNANFGGGGINNFAAAALTLNNSTISGNAALAVGGGINNGGGTVELKNTIVADNTVGGDCSGTAPNSLGYNLDSDGTCNLNVALGDKISANANLGALQNNGGPTETHALLAGSDAIDMGNPDQCKDAAGNPVTADQRGFVRPINAICDIGAYEFESHLQIPVGGLTSFSSGSGWSAGSIALLAGGVAAFVAFAAGGWYTRRRRLSR